MILQLIGELLLEYCTRRPRCPCRRTRTMSGWPLCRSCFAAIARDEPSLVLEFDQAARTHNVRQITRLTPALRMAARYQRQPRKSRP